MTVTALPLTKGTPTAPPTTVPDTPPAASAAPASVPAAAPPTSATTAPAPAGSLKNSLTPGQRKALGVIGLAALLLAGIGLYLSFEHVAVFAHEKLHFQTLDKARLMTVGVDVGILVMIAADLFLAWIRRPIAWIRYPVWLLTLTTVVLNSASAAPEGRAWGLLDYVAAFAHGVVPCLFITVVEIGKALIERVVRPDGHETAGVPLMRWILAPAPTFGLWRRMKLWGLASYREAVERDQELRVYRIMLEREYGSVDKAPKDKRLPITMRRYGLSVAEALALPQEQRDRQKAEEEALEAARAAEKEAEADRGAQARIAAAERQAAIAEAEAKAAAAAGRAKVAAEAELTAAQRAAELQAVADQSAVTAEADARRAAAEREAAEAREAAAEVERRAAEAEKAAAEARRVAAEAERKAAEDAAAIERAKADAAHAQQSAAEAARAAAEERALIAGIEKAAAEAEDAAKLTPKERAIRRVARLILAEAGGDAKALPLERISEVLNVGTSVASERRNEAAALLQDGYRPDGL